MDGHPTNGAAMFADANFLDAEDTRPPSAFLEILGGSGDAIQGIVQQIQSRHMAEVHPDIRMSSSQHGLNWRKRLREMMMRQNEDLLSFLHKPITEHSILGSVESTLRRYSIRHDVDPDAIVNVRTILSDVSGAAIIQSEIEAEVSRMGASSLPELKSQVSALFELYKTTGEQVLECENQIKLLLDKMTAIQSRVSIVMELQSNDALAPVTDALEKYLEIAFKDLRIEEQYKRLLYLYQKHIALRDTIHFFRAGSQGAAEPICPICLQEPVTSVITPCGHTFCSGCSRRMSTECYLCRGKIRERVKLFFS
jgi:hypothetical protein